MAALDAPPGSPPARERALVVCCWAAVWLVSVVWLAATEYGGRDPDSQLYAGLAARLAQQPVERWIAPEWWGFWNSHGPYQEHPVGLFVVAAWFATLGYPPLQAAYAVNGLYQIVSFALVGLIAAAIVPRHEARALAWLVQLLPIAFVFRVRANQEYAVLAGFLLAIYATERARRAWGWVPVMVAAFCWVLLVKGVFALMVPVACAVWLVARAGALGELRDSWRAALGLALMPLAGVLVALSYDAAYQGVTGASFLAAYRSRQMPPGAVSDGAPAARVAYSLVWYLGRVVWFAFPWSLVAGAMAVAACRRDVRRALLPWTASSGRADGRQGAWFALVTAAALVVAFSFAHRKAERYIFPAYFLVGAAGAAAAVRHPRLAPLVARLDRAWVPAAVWLVLFALRMATAGRLPEFTFWRS